MGSLTERLTNHKVSSEFEESARHEPVEAHEALRWSSDIDEISLCPVECIKGSLSTCHTEKERACPSRSTLMEFLLPLKIHFRYCWLFSGVPRYNTVYKTKLLTDQELLYVNRMLMTGEQPELCRQVCCERCDGTGCRRDMKAFWLTTDGKLVLVDCLCEDVKFRRLREKKLRVALSLWTAKPELCGEMMRTSDVAHGTLLKICEEATRLSRGGFHNLYAKYPLPINMDAERDASPELLWVDEETIRKTEIRNGSELLLELWPLYMAYFNFVSDNPTSDMLNDRVSLLGAQWLVLEERSELQFSLNLRRNWFVRTIIRLSLFFVDGL